MIGNKMTHTLPGSFQDFSTRLMGPKIGDEQLLACVTDTLAKTINPPQG
jgi:hypothetical protein